jgi:hypothetical protein
MISAGELIPAAATLSGRVARSAVSTRCRRVVPFCTTAAGWSAGRPWAIIWRQISANPPTPM